MEFFKKYLNRRMQRMVFMVLLSLLLWMFIKFGRNYETNISIPLKVIGIPQDSTLKYSLSDNIELRVEGKGIDLLRLGLGLHDAESIIDCQDISDSSVIKINSPYFDLKVPSSIHLNKKRFIKPKILTVVLEKNLEKKLLVKPVSRITTEAGYIVTGINTTPDTVLISGPESFLKELKTVKTKMVISENNKSPFTKNVKLDIPSKYHLVPQTKRVMLTVDIQKLGEMYLDNVNVQVVKVPTHRKVVPLPSTVRLKITGGTEILSKIRKENFEVRIDYNQYQPGNKISAIVITDLNLQSVTIEPNEFELIILRR